MKPLFLFTMLFLSSCTHTVPSTRVSPDTLQEVKAAVDRTCQDRCEIDQCWWETSTLVVCRVAFSMTTSFTQSEILKNTLAEFKKSHLKIGFCGVDSAGTQLLASAIGGLAGGATRAATHSSGTTTYIATSSTVTSPSDSTQMDTACETEPVSMEPPSGYQARHPEPFTQPAPQTN